MTGLVTTDSPLGIKEGEAFTYDAFISYRRQDAGWHARTLRQRLLDVRIPPAALSDRPSRRLQIYLDQIYEQATDDFFEHTIKPALRASRHLIIVQSASAAQSLPDGRSNWLVREIEYFRTLPSEGRTVSVAMTSGDLNAALPAGLDRTLPNIERLDLRRWRWYQPARTDDQLLTLAATLHGITPSAMPIVRREDARRRAAQARVRWLLAGTLMLAAAIGFGQYSRVRDAAERNNTAIATSLWNRLDFLDGNRVTADELKTLWEIRLATAAVREASITELTRNPDRMIRLGRRPDPVARALFLRWPSDQTDVVFRAVLQAIGNTTEPDQLKALGSALKAMARKLSLEQSRLAQAALVKAIRGTKHADQIAAFTQGVGGLSGRLTAGQEQEVLALAVNAIGMTSDATQLSVLAQAAEVVPAKFDDEAAAIAVAAVLKELEGSSSIADHNMRWKAEEGLDSALAALVRKLTAEQARAAFSPVLSAMRNPMSPGAPEVVALAHALSGFAPNLTSEQANTAFRTAFDVAQKPDLNSDSQVALGPALSALAERLPSEHAQTALAPAVKAVQLSTDEFQREALASAVRGLANKVTPEQARSAKELVKRAILGAVDPLQPRVIFPNAVRMAKLEPYAALLRQIRDSTSSPFVLEELASAMTPLVHDLAVNQPEKAFRNMLSTLEGVTDRERIAAVESVMTAFVRELSPQHATPVLAIILTVFRGDNGTIDVLRLGAIGRVGAGVASKLRGPDAQAMLMAVIGKIPGTTNPFAHQALVTILTAFANELPPEQRELAATHVRATLAWSQTSAGSVASAKALAALMRRDAPPVRRIADIVEALKYPIGTAETTEILLDSLKEVATEAPGRNAGLEANLEWIARIFRASDVDLDAAPSCPDSRWKTLACPRPSK